MDDTSLHSTHLARDESVDHTKGFDEDSQCTKEQALRPLAKKLVECRNVLVRYCAHVPRNYQYRDGIRLVR